jgi:hypothetical protein
MTIWIESKEKKDEEIEKNKGYNKSRDKIMDNRYLVQTEGR